MEKKKHALPLSGSEPTCTKAPYALPSAVPRNNCYAYAVQHLARRGKPSKLQPGNLSGLQGTDFDLTTCHPSLRRVIRDLYATGTGYKESLDRPCRVGYGKIALLLSKGNDFHFLRQNKDVIYPVEPGETPSIIAKKFKVPVAQIVPISKKRVRVVDAGVWSHKRGTAYPPSLYDAKGKIIFDPRTADMNYGYLNYSRVCGAYCVKQKRCRKRV